MATDDHASGPRSEAKACPADAQSRERQIGQRVFSYPMSPTNLLILLVRDSVVREPVRELVAGMFTASTVSRASSQLISTSSRK
jgi:hypothetical protein